MTVELRCSSLFSPQPYSNYNLFFSPLRFSVSYRTLLWNLYEVSRDGILGHQFNKRFEYFAPTKNPLYKKTRIYSWNAFLERKNEGRKPDKNSRSEKTRVYVQKPQLKILFKNSISGLVKKVQIGLLKGWVPPFSGGGGEGCRHLTNSRAWEDSCPHVAAQGWPVKGLQPWFLGGPAWWVGGHKCC